MMARCIDLHVHTCFSDGTSRLGDVLSYSAGFDAISITDHNTLNGTMRLMSQFGRNLSTGSKLLPGVELRLPGLPDYLLYFPRATDSSLDHAQKWVERIDELDQLVTVHVAKSLLRRNDPLGLWVTADPCASCNKKFFGTLQLTLLLAGENYTAPDFRSCLAQVRKAKSAVFRDPPSQLSKEVSELLDMATPEAVSSMSQKLDAEIVLAHPMKELGRAAKGCLPLDEKAISSGLEKLHCWLLDGKINCVEHIALPANGKWWNQHFSVGAEVAGRLLLSWANQLGLGITIGTDTHSLAPSEKEDCRIYAYETAKLLNDHAPAWLLNFLGKEG